MAVLERDPPAAADTSTVIIDTRVSISDIRGSFEGGLVLPLLSQARCLWGRCLDEIGFWTGVDKSRHLLV